MDITPSGLDYYKNGYGLWLLLSFKKFLRKRNSQHWPMAKLSIEIIKASSLLAVKHTTNQLGSI
jgi:hypothetical protein